VSTLTISALEMIQRLRSKVGSRLGSWDKVLAMVGGAPSADGVSRRLEVVVVIVPFGL
jgi:molybdopterin-guanine dinucleotide biosynthesis protein A